MLHKLEGYAKSLNYTVTWKYRFRMTLNFLWSMIVFYRSNKRPFFFKPTKTPWKNPAFYYFGWGIRFFLALKLQQMRVFFNPYSVGTRDTQISMLWILVSRHRMNTIESALESWKYIFSKSEKIFWDFNPFL